MSGVVAVDPGGTIGVAIELYTPPDKLIKTCTFTNPEDIWKFAADPTFDTIVVERFITSGRVDKYGMLTIEIVGGLKAIAITTGKKLVTHLPQNRYAWQKDAHLWLVDQSDPFVIHEEDALAHLLCYLETGR